MGTGGKAEAVGFAHDIRPLFRKGDVDAMRRHHLDLQSFKEVSGSADENLAKLDADEMPCEGAWPEEQLALFRKWIADGKAL